MSAIPAPIWAVLQGLRFDAAQPEAIASIQSHEWPPILAFLDRTQLSLILLLSCRDHLPTEVRQRLEQNLAANHLRFNKLAQAYAEIATALEFAGIPFVILKGFSQSPWFTSEPGDRVQYDLDLYCPPGHVHQAREQLLQLGYEALTGYERHPIDHLPVLVKKTGWEWKGDYFDPEIPISVDLHFRFWNESNERFLPEGLEYFWTRRQQDGAGGLSYPALHPADRLAYACLHLLRHILHGNARPSHVYELSWFLERNAGNTEFWEGWRTLHGDSLQRPQAICFAIARQWFGCRLSPQAEAAVDALPDGVKEWITQYALAPLEGQFIPNKHELWLHLNLVDSNRDRAAVLFRRLIPTTLPGEVDAVLLPEEQLTPWIRLRRRWKYLAHLATRAAYHARAALPTLIHGASWLSRSQGIDPGLWRFLSAAWLYELGLFVFMLLYNLQLIDLGYKENFLGTVSSAQTAGSFVAALPMGALLQRKGPAWLISTAFVALGAVFALRAVVTGSAALLVSAFAGGVILSAFTVAFAPAIARLTNPRSRSLGYSIFFSSGVAMGILGGLLGGRLPGWFAAIGAPGKKSALLASCLLVVVAAWPVSRLRLPSAQPSATPARVYPRNPVVWRYLAALIVWNLATGAFNPFFNAYFTNKLHADVSGVGSIFAVSQFAQAVAMLSAPLVLRRFGLIPGIVAMQLAASAGLLGLSWAASAGAGAALYIAYMAAQWMSEPGMYSVLMNPLSKEEMGGAAALNMMAILLAQLIAASAAGAAITRFGYSVTLGGAGILAAVAAVLFWILLRGTQDSSTPAT
ncbi:MFS transporter [Paludibaculum fermentans]|uniref:MFS transporter n=1 Tax=Paludibaculum fermentans TaxID=1473598 RepID=UPI003EB77E99